MHRIRHDFHSVNHNDYYYFGWLDSCVCLCVCFFIYQFENLRVFFLYSACCSLKHEFTQLFRPIFDECFSPCSAFSVCVSIFAYVSTVLHVYVRITANFRMFGLACIPCHLSMCAFQGISSNQYERHSAQLWYVTPTEMEDVAKLFAPIYLWLLGVIIFPHTEKNDKENEKERERKFSTRIVQQWNVNWSSVNF